VGACLPAGLHGAGRGNSLPGRPAIAEAATSPGFARAMATPDSTLVEFLGVATRAISAGARVHHFVVWLVIVAKSVDLVVLFRRVAAVDAQDTADFARRRWGDGEAASKPALCPAPKNDRSFMCNEILTEFMSHTCNSRTTLVTTRPAQRRWRDRSLRHRRPGAQGLQSEEGRYQNIPVTILSTVKQDTTQHAHTHTRTERWRNKKRETETESEKQREKDEWERETERKTERQTERMRERQTQF